MTRALANCQSLLKLPAPAGSGQNQQPEKQANFLRNGVPIRRRGRRCNTLDVTTCRTRVTPFIATHHALFTEPLKRIPQDKKSPGPLIEDRGFFRFLSAGLCGFAP